MDTEKTGQRKGSILRDSELMGEKYEPAQEEAMHWSELTAEELEVQKKLRRKIDSLIMPCVILVYLMNYIDRYVCQTHPCSVTYTFPPATTTPRHVSKVWKRISIYKATNTESA